MITIVVPLLAALVGVLILAVASKPPLLVELGRALLLGGIIACLLIESGRTAHF